MSSHSGAHAGDLFATSNAPYIKYLEAVDGWQEAEGFKDYLLEASHQVAHRSHHAESHGDDWTTAALLDVRFDSTGTTSTIDAVASLRESDVRSLSDGTIGATLVTQFLENMHDCRPDTHMRIIVLQDHGRFRDRDAAIDSLLFCHVLGIELDLEPALVAMFAQSFSFQEKFGKVSSMRQQQL
jgi:hypothetical protein